MSTPSTTNLPPELGSNPHTDALSKLVRECLLEAQTAGYDQLATIVERRASASDLSRDGADTPAGNVFEAISRPVREASPLLAHLLARSAATSGDEDVHVNARLLVHVAARTPIDALAVLDEVAGADAGPIWQSIADLVVEHDGGGELPWADALVAAAALGASTSDVATARREQLARSLRNVALVHLLRPVVAASAPTTDTPTTDTATTVAPLKGELVSAPRSVVKTLLLGAIGWLLLASVARVVARSALQLRRPAELLFTQQGVRVRSTTTLLGKVVREQETLIPLDGLARATREVCFSRAGVYSGLIALALGSYFGVSWFIDGVRVGSLSLAAVGLLVLAVGIALDFVLMVVLPGTKGRCRLLFVPTRGGDTCIGDVEASAADAFLQGLVRR
ncbi:MAG: hypothetical protein MUF54_00245 [Polyangiaceae bacterium]|jgi:hypothetical protein|nr:hypothetical protein [Polyangiaceae bacterium]